MQKIQEILNRHIDSNFDDRTLAVIDALLNWSTKPQEPASPAVPENRWWEDYDGPSNASPTIDKKQDEHDSLLSDALSLAASAFRLVSTDGSKTVEHSLKELAERIRFKSLTRLSEVQGTVDDAENILDQVEQLKNRLQNLQEKKTENKEQLERLEEDFFKLQSENAGLEDKARSLRQQIDTQNVRKTDLTAKENELREQQGLIDKKNEEIGDFSKSLAKKKREYEVVQNELQRLQSERAMIESEMTQMKNRIQETNHLIQDLKKSGYSPDVLKKIQEVWKLLPEDKLDKEIKNIQQ